MDTIRKTLVLGKVAYQSKDKVNECDFTLELRFKDNAINYIDLQPVSKDKAIELSICGNIWNSKHTDCERAGQCIDTIAELFPARKDVRRIKEVWEQYHLNDMRAGTKKQVDAIEAWRTETNTTGYAYDEEKKYLESIDLLTDNGVIWGHQWLFMPIPTNIIDEIKDLFNV